MHWIRPLGYDFRICQMEKLGITSRFTYSFLISVIVLQWIFTTYLLRSMHHHRREEPPSGSRIFGRQSFSSKGRQPTRMALSDQDDIPVFRPKGVLATIIFRAPKWMHLRYTQMIHNALTVLPQDWAVQLFLNKLWVDKELIPWHPGFVRLMRDPRVLVHEIPTNLTLGKPKQVLLSDWFWETIAADGAILFSANGAFCGNHPDPSFWDYLLDNVDYCGSPSRHGTGGDGGTHSFRNRKAMLKVLDFAHRHGLQPTGGSEFAFVVDIMSKMNANHHERFRIASAEISNKFGGVLNLSSSDRLERLPLVVSGTQPNLDWNARESLLKHCPEIKMIFPSLHEPSCFGAHPNGEICKTTICALQENRPKQGC